MAHGVDEKQVCPFCNAQWGTCDHYLLLAEWENDASRREADKLQEEAAVKSDGQRPEPDQFIENR